MKMKACKHLDHVDDGRYGHDITLETCAPQYPEVKFWKRGETWTNNGDGLPPNPSKVQFCGAGRGRINGIFQCYNEGEMPCYETSPAQASQEGVSQLSTCHSEPKP